MNGWMNEWGARESGGVDQREVIDEIRWLTALAQKTSSVHSYRGGTRSLVRVETFGSESVWCWTWFIPLPLSAESRWGTSPTCASKTRHAQYFTLFTGRYWVSVVCLFWDLSDICVLFEIVLAHSIKPCFMVNWAASVYFQTKWGVSDKRTGLAFKWV